ncbi:L-alanine-DL-glutamate epimerase-like enolase superfamily enzyme [Streptomyces aurantiacus]|uniref:dipeptide epimerase n=1 Tax=Streptomyces aurantiacus TaxID=47760 RepID=UPI00278EAA68|nr:dipeptide epimerase [Streptomyces aurantiacus]MDQ0772476.1 L-alanine-DL-glutamate epimerase-like enolase superfamily enzyme [Streptomyces aurantiacus]
MKATLRTVRLALAEPLRISRSTMAARDAVWLTVEHEGLHGHGEAVTSVYYGLDTATLEGRLYESGRELSRFPDPESALREWSSDTPQSGTRQAGTRQPGERRSGERPPAVTAAVEAALLDLCGRRAGAPVYRLLRADSDAGSATDAGAGGAPSARTARTIGIVPAPHAAAQARALVAAGFGLLKAKAGTPDPEDDLDRIRAIRAAAPHARLLLDPNGAWTSDQARQLIPRFAELGVEAVEQPVAPGDPEALARLAERSPLPLIADEDAVGHEDVRRLAGRVHGVNVKLAKCGGPRAALRIAELIAGSGTELMLGCLTASTLGLAPAVHLADRARWADLDGHLLLADDPWTGIGGADGIVRASDLPGLGVREKRAGEAGGP